MNRLKEIREKQGMTQKEFAEILEMYTTQYCRYEREEVEMKQNTIIEICKKLKISADYLLGLKNK